MGSLLLVAAAVVFATGVALRLFIGRRADSAESQRRMHAFRQTKFARVLFGSVYDDEVFDPDELDQMVLMPTIAPRLRPVPDRVLPAGGTASCSTRRGGPPQRRRRRRSIRATAAPCPGSITSASTAASVFRLARQPSSSWLNRAGSSVAAGVPQQRMSGDQGVAADQNPVDDEGTVPAGVVRGWEPAPDCSGRSSCARSPRPRGRDAAVVHPAPLAVMVAAHFTPAGLPDVADHVRRSGLLEILTLGVPEFGTVAKHRCAMGFRQPDGRAEVVDVGVGQQDGGDVVDGEPELGGPSPMTSSRLPREPRVDQHDPVSVGHQRPVDQVGLCEVHDAR